MSHVYHDPSAIRRGVDADAVLLFDGCDRCERIADHPLSELDDDRVRLLWAEMLRVERPVRGLDGDRGDLRAYRTVNEARACRRLHEVGLFLERLGWGPRSWTIVPEPRP